MEEVILVITNLPDRESALALAETLVQRQLAACVNVMSPCTSVYAWKGSVETTEEHPLLIKTLRLHYSKVEEAIRQLHPYELPEIVAVPLADGLKDYLRWVAEETTGSLVPDHHGKP